MQDLSLIKIIGLIMFLIPISVMMYITGLRVGFSTALWAYFGVISCIFGAMLASFGSVSNTKEFLLYFVQKEK